MTSQHTEKYVSEPKDFVHCLHVGTNTETGELMIVRNTDQFSEELEVKILELTATAGASQPTENYSAPRPPPPPPPPLPPSSERKSFKQKFFEMKLDRKNSKEVAKPRFSKEDIGGPTNFQHINSGSTKVSSPRQEEVLEDEYTYAEEPVWDDCFDNSDLPAPLQPQVVPIAKPADPHPSPDSAPKPLPRRSKSKSEEVTTSAEAGETEVDESVYEVMENP